MIQDLTDLPESNRLVDTLFRNVHNIIVDWAPRLCASEEERKPAHWFMTADGGALTVAFSLDSVRQEVPRFEFVVMLLDETRPGR